MKKYIIKLIPNIKYIYRSDVYVEDFWSLRQVNYGVGEYSFEITEDKSRSKIFTKTQAEKFLKGFNTNNGIFIESPIGFDYFDYTALKEEVEEEQ